MVERHATLEQRLDFLEQAIGLDLKDNQRKKLEQGHSKMLHVS